MKNADTKEQKKVLKSFRCESVSANAINEELMQSFTSKTGSFLLSYFSRFDMKEDINGSATYYVIKDVQNEIMMFY